MGRRTLSDSPEFSTSTAIVQTPQVLQGELIQPQSPEWFNREHRALQDAHGSFIDRMRELGNALNVKKESLGHGKWGKWVEENLTFSADTATNYMNLAKLPIEDYEHVRNLPMREVSKLASKKQAKPRTKQNNEPTPAIQGVPEAVEPRVTVEPAEDDDPGEVVEESSEQCWHEDDSVNDDFTDDDVGENQEFFNPKGFTPTPEEQEENPPIEPDNSEELELLRNKVAELEAQADLLQQELDGAREVAELNSNTVINYILETAQDVDRSKQFYSVLDDWTLVTSAITAIGKRGRPFGKRRKIT